MTQSTIFYSWQSELPNATNRGFIERALERAVGALHADESIEVEPVIDRDTAGVPGAPNIGATIFEKIEGADVFVCDVSLVFQIGETDLGKRTTAVRNSPNPNVLFEAGYALKCLGPERMIFIANAAYGSPEQLPFDLRFRRILTYHASPDDSERSGERRRLEGALLKALQAIYELPRTPRSVEEVPPPAVSLDEGLYAYVNGSALVRRYDQALASMYGLPLKSEYGSDFVWLKEQFAFFGITNVREVDNLLREHGDVAYYMGVHSRPHDHVFPGQILGLLVEIMVARLGSKEEIDTFKKTLTATSGGWWHDCPRYYEIAKAYAAECRASGIKSPIA